MKLSELYALYKQHPVVTTDSRACSSGSLFFALRGASFDGNAYAGEALQAGCAYAVVDDAAALTDRRTIPVDNVLETLQQLARLHRSASNVTVVGITGTCGKTTTKELIARVLCGKYPTLYTEGNLNNAIGVPLTLLRLTGRHEMAVVEMGAGRRGEIRDLAEIARPDYGLITNVGYAHLEGFGSLEGVVRTKGELYDFIRKTHGRIFLDLYNPYLTPLAEGLETITYGKKPSIAGKKAPGVLGEVLRCDPFLSFRWQRRNEASQCTEAYDVATHLVGDYNLHNALAAIAVGLHFGLSPERINEALSAYEPTNHRSQWKRTPHNQLIIDAYNANPGSMRAALENFAQPAAKDAARGPKAVILGDMRELGGKSAEFHAAILSLIDTYGFEQTLLCGEQFSAAAAAQQARTYTCFGTVAELGEYLRTNPPKGYEILIKGSHGMHLERIIDYL